MLAAARAREARYNAVMTQEIHAQSSLLIDRSVIGCCLARVLNVFIIAASALLLPAPGLAGDSLVIGRVSSDPARDVQRMQPMVDYVASKLQRFGIEKGEVLVAQDVEQLHQYLEQGRIDWITETAAIALELAEGRKCQVMLQRAREGALQYHGVIVVREHSEIHSLADLVGHRIAFEDPGSTSAYHLPAALIVNEGLQLELLSTPREAVPAGRIGAVFSSGELNSSIWLERGLVDAAAFSNLDWNDPWDVPKAHRSEFRILARTKPVPRNLELFRTDLGPDVVAAMQQVLLQAANDPAAKEAMDRFNRTTEFALLTDQDWNLLNTLRQEMVKAGTAP